jgi:hypothetical protein
MCITEGHSKILLLWLEPERTGANNAVLVTAARVRFGMNVKSLVRAAARDGKR